MKTFLAEFYVFKIIKLPGFPKCGLPFLPCSGRERETVSLDITRDERQMKKGEEERGGGR